MSTPNKQRQENWRNRQREQGRSRVEYWLTPIERRAFDVLLDDMRDADPAKKRWKK